MQNKNLKTIEGVSPPAPYLGGKHRLAKRLAGLITGIDHDLYAEPFVGMGGVFFRRTHAPRCEVINDISGDVVTLFRILQRHYPQFMETLKFQITSRREFERLVRVDPSVLTDLERAARFLYLQRTAFGGKVQGRTFGISRDRGSRFNLTRLAPLLEDVHERLAGVTIERLPWPDFLARYDRSGTLFYLDPPYWGCEQDYGKEIFSREDFDRLAEALSELKGRFILSINDTPATRELFDRFVIEPVSLTYSVASSNNVQARELIVSSRL